MILHFDILYIGNDEIFWNNLLDLAKDFEITILNCKHASDSTLIRDDFSFTLVLSELHLDYNFEGYTIEKIGLKYSYFGILTNEIDSEAIMISDMLFKSQKKFLILKNPNIVKILLQSPMKYNISNNIPLEA
jgi:hypothetical protein